MLQFLKFGDRFVNFLRVSETIASTLFYLIIPRNVAVVSLEELYFKMGQTRTSTE